jgi:hypothetical protein
MQTGRQADGASSEAVVEKVKRQAGFQIGCKVEAGRKAIK